MKKQSLRILLVDDHEIFRDGMKSLLQEIPGLDVIGEASNGHKAMKLTEMLAPDVVLTDIQMAEMDGVKLTSHLKEKHPQIKVIILTMLNNDAMIDKMRLAGADAYLTKTVSKEDLISVLYSVFNHTNAFNLKRTVEENKIIPDSIQKKCDSLTKREKEILGLIAKGYTDKEIAGKLFLSHYTVITHRKNLLSKLHLNNKVELARFAIENDLSDTD